MNQEEQGKKVQKVIAKAWTDEGYKQRLLADPEAVLKQEGMEIPEGIRIKVVENTDKVFYFVLPAKPSSEELSDEQLDAAAGESLVVPIRMYWKYFGDSLRRIMTVVVCHAGSLTIAPYREYAGELRSGDAHGCRRSETGGSLTSAEGRLR